MKTAPRVNSTVAKLLARAAEHPVAPDARHRQLVSLAYGNLKMENDCVTRRSVEEVAAKILALHI